MANAGNSENPLDALRAATRLDWKGLDDPARARFLLAVIADLLKADVVVVGRADERTGELRPVVVTGDETLSAAAAGIAEHLLLEGARAEGCPLHVSVGDGGPVGARLAAAALSDALVLPLAGRGRPSGAVCAVARGALVRDADALHSVRVAAERVGWLRERTRLYATLERAMAQILESDERMLGRIGLDIHDGPTQHLSVALLEVQLLEAELSDIEAAGGSLPDALRPALGRIYETLGGALHEMRELIGHLRPTQFESRLLPDILKDAVVAHEARTGNGVEAQFEGDFADPDVSLSQKITFYRILQEALTNAHRHGHAEGVEVRVVQDAGGIQLVVRDDGRGFSTDILQSADPGTPQPRYGLHGMRDRANLLGGTFMVDSAPGAGTTVRVHLPRWVPDDAPDTDASSV